MHVCRFWEPKLGPRLGLLFEETVVDITAIDPVGCGDIANWLTMANPIEHMEEIEALTLRSKTRLHIRELEHTPSPGGKHLLPPLDVQEVWGAGVTYERMRVSHVDESHGGKLFYDEVYDAERPELFFKATSHRVVGPLAPIRVRCDSDWTIPEPELTVVLSPSMEIIGYTCANDVTSRDIEGENPLYMAQSKTYSGCCAIGPVITLASAIPDPTRVEISMLVIRDGMTVFRDETNTDRMKRTIPDLVEWLGRDNTFPQGVFLMTGSGIAPPDDFSLEPEDSVEINIQGIGRLVNPVVKGPPLA
jgi:2-dehydro-3-deoxy-D-arabinonate dehydratase